jgi:TRAP-type transport system periplasmic protein
MAKGLGLHGEAAQALPSGGLPNRLDVLLMGPIAWAKDVQERTIKFSHLNNADHPVSFGIKRFAEILAAKSGGKLKVQEFAASQLDNELQQRQPPLQGHCNRTILKSQSGFGSPGVFDFPEFLICSSMKANLT